MDQRRAPATLLVLPDGTIRLINGHDTMFGFAGLRGLPRHDHHLDLPPGATVLLYSDGLVERRGLDIDTGISRLTAFLPSVAHERPRQVVDAVVDRLGKGSTDDVVAFALRSAPAA